MNNDLISRSKLKEEINSTIAQATKVGIMVDTNYLWELLNYAIDNAPAVEYPFYQEAYQTGYEEGKNERPQGEWKHIVEEDNDVECPFCGLQEDGIYYNYCPSCGARLKGGAE